MMLRTDCFLRDKTCLGTYLAHHELESIVIIITVNIINVIIDILF